MIKYLRLKPSLCDIRSLFICVSANNRIQVEVGFGLICLCEENLIHRF